MSSGAPTAMLVRPTSSSMPTVKRRRGRSRAELASTPATIAGVNSFDERP